MPYVLVLLVAAAAGGGVAVATLRRGAVAEANPQAWTKGYESEEAPGGGGPTQARGRSRALPSAPTWQTRLTGIVGLLIAVLVGAGLIVGVCFAAWAALRRAFGA